MVYEKVLSILKDISGNEKIARNHHLQNDIGLDSLGLVALLVKIENEFNIQLIESDMNPFDLLTVDDVIKLVDKYK